jgi:CBS domain containing-hemolysin-like protein
VFSGSETGFYTLSHRRVHFDERHGRTSARLVRKLLQDDAGLLTTILIGNNLMHELCSHLGADMLTDLEFPVAWREVAGTLILTPVIFFFAEVLPKDLFRRRPHALVGHFAPFLVFMRLLFWPLSILLQGITTLLARGFGLEPRAVTGYHGREQVLGFLEEGKLAGVLPAHAEVLAQNALRLPSIPIERVMSPWRDAVCVRATDEAAVRLEAVRRSHQTRLPVIGEDGKVESYLHQIEVLTGEGGKEGGDVLTHLRPLLALEPSTPADRALIRLRASAQRLALVGTPEAPLGLVSLKDLVEEISGDLASW